jgi:hypothetical protein
VERFIPNAPWSQGGGESWKIDLRSVRNQRPPFPKRTSASTGVRPSSFLFENADCPACHRESTSPHQNAMPDATADGINADVASSNVYLRRTAWCAAFCSDYMRQREVVLITNYPMATGVLKLNGSTPTQSPRPRSLSIYS